MRVLFSISLTAWITLMGMNIAAASTSYPPQVGEPHPDFVLPRIDSAQPVSLSQFLGKKVLLINFASW